MVNAAGKQKHVNIDDERHAKLKMQAALERRALIRLLEEAIDDLLEKRKSGESAGVVTQPRSAAEGVGSPDKTAEAK